MLAAGQKFWLNFAIITNTILISLSFNAKTIADSIDFIENPLARLYMWHETAEPIRRYINSTDIKTVVADERKIITPLMYNLRRFDSRPYIVYKWNPSGRIRDHYDLTARYYGQDEYILFITRTKKNAEFFAKYFEYYKKVTPKEMKEPFELYELSDFKEDSIQMNKTNINNPPR